MTRSRNTSRIRTVVALAALSIGASACGGDVSWTPQWGPGPSDGIAVSVIDSTTYQDTPVVHCDGPSAEVAEFGTLCSTTWDYTTLVQDAGDMGFVLYGQVGNRWNAIVVFGYFVTPDAGAAGPNSEIRYAARLVQNVGAPHGSVVAVEQDVALWATGDELTGSVATWRAIGEEACQFDIFAGVAAFQWKSSTITIRFNAGLPC